MKRYRRRNNYFGLFSGVGMREIFFILLIIGGLALTTYFVSNIVEKPNLSEENNAVIKKVYGFMLFPDMSMDEIFDKFCLGK